MKHWEVVYETGAHSVMSVDDEDAARAAVKNHHDRAKNGEPGGPLGHSAERVVAIYEYEDHPADLVDDMSQQPIDPDAGVHDSKYVAEGTEVDLAFLED